MLALRDSVGRRRLGGRQDRRVVTVQLVDNAFRRTSHQTTLPNPTNSTDRLYRVAVELMRQMWPARPVRLVGVSAEKTGEDNFEQMDLFTDAARIDKQEKLDRRRRCAAPQVWRRCRDPRHAADPRHPQARGTERRQGTREREKMTGAAARTTSSGHPRTAARGQSMAASIDKQVYYAYNTLKARYKTGKGGGTLGKFQRAAIS